MDWLNTVLGASAAATLWTIFRGIQMLRNDTANHTARAVADMERWREEADERTRAARADADWALDLADYWRDRAMTREIELRENGAVITDPKPLPQRPPPRIQET